MPVLNTADDVKFGAEQVDAVYYGDTQVWSASDGPGVIPIPEAFLELDERYLDGATIVEIPEVPGVPGSSVVADVTLTVDDGTPGNSLDIVWFALSGPNAPRIHVGWTTEQIQAEFDAKATAAGYVDPVGPPVVEISGDSPWVLGSTFTVEAISWDANTFFAPILGVSLNGSVATVTVTTEGAAPIPEKPAITAITRWPNLGSLGSYGDAIIYEPDGSTEGNGFAIGTENDHSTITSVKDNDSRMASMIDWCGVEFLGDATTKDVTFVYMITIGEDCPVDGSEICPVSFHVDNAYYQDIFVIDGDRETSNTAGYDFPSQTGGPQVGDTLIVTRLHRWSYTDESGPPAEEAWSFSHIDGYEADPQHIYTSSPYGDVFPEAANIGEYPGVMISGYPGGGYSVPGRWRRVLGFDRILTVEELTSVQQNLAAQALEDGIVVTLYDFPPYSEGP